MTREHQSPTTTTSSIDVVEGSMRLRQLRVVHAPSPPRRPIVVLEPGEKVSIGREESSRGAPLEEPPTLVVKDREVSRVHATFEHDPITDGWTVVDRGSRNGTIVNGRRVDRAELSHGSIVRVGKTLVLYQDLDVTPSERLLPETPRLLGPSLALQRVRAEIALVAPRKVPVLILGESGVGKELVAEEIHRQSGRKGPLLPVNCASIPAELAESELFGHQAGAFTGAQRREKGLFVAAEGGTIFLDEIGEMPIAIQPKLLRALSKNEIRAVGASETQEVDVRVVAATHQDLGKLVAEGKFRGDLFARLSGFPLRVPPLRERREDIIALAQAFAARHDGPKIACDAAEALLLYGFPYNVRELEQAIASAAVRAGDSGVIKAEHLPPEIGAPVRARATAPQKAEPPLEVLVARDQTPSKEDLVRVLERFEGNVALVAEFFGKDRHQVYRWAKRYDLDLDAFRSA